MKRWRTHLLIVTYLSVLFSGVALHALKYREHDHPLMYYIVWDMFCGWSAWETRLHIVAEGESGAIYSLAPGPWGEYHPFSNINRHHYDSYVEHARRLAMHTLQHSRHEPIQQIVVYEEAWQKKFNLPPELQQTLNPPPGTPQTIVVKRDTYGANGEVIQRGQSFYERMTEQYVTENERLQRQMQGNASARLLVSRTIE
jgi:hypothetical protein